uniref:Uncharacterized protein n=1 Tax=Hordeum vulgare subsp. vulgare TaxID=112509 RepID=A0A8I6X6G2_HORVV
MPRLSSTLAPTRQRSVAATSSVLVTLFFLALFIGSCEPRRLLVHGATATSSEPPPAPCKTKHLSTADVKDPCVDHFGTRVKAGGVAIPSAAARTAAVGRVSRQLSHRDLQVVGTAFHLDYAGPETHPPIHN